MKQKIMCEELSRRLHVFEKTVHTAGREKIKRQMQLLPNLLAGCGRNKKLMRKKIYVTTAVLLVCLGFLAYRIYAIGAHQAVADAASAQSVYQLRVAKTRGMIYDCNLEPLVNREWQTVTAVAPTVETIAQLTGQFGDSYRDVFKQALENRNPFSFVTEEAATAENVYSFKVPSRYSADQPAAHVIGYTDAQGNGAAGIELAMDAYLNQTSGEISLYYKVDALGQVIAGIQPKIVNSIKEEAAGVVLTLDANIQRIAEKAAEQLGAGAVVVTEVPNGEIRAMVSVPGYTPDTVSAVLQNQDAPLVNRCLSAYSPGSVFKLVTAAAAIEEGADGFQAVCTGTYNVNGMDFSCYGQTAHGRVNLRTALEKSCNCYFIRLAQRTDAQSLLRMAYNLGFGVRTEFAPQLYASSGNLPTAESLLNNRALANFSFGQGELTATPLQIAAMMNTIASGGEYTGLKLVVGTVDNNLQLTPTRPEQQDSKVRMMEISTAKRLQSMLKLVVTSGTGKSGKPDNCVAGAKTGTAQTGVYNETGAEKNNFWYSGFICDKAGPKYCITVLRESAVTDGGAAAKAFKEIAESISDSALQTR